MYKIERSIPIPTPEAPKRGGRPRKYPVADLAVGESFLVPQRSAEGARQVAVAYKRSNPGWNYTGSQTETGYRIWRTA